MKNNATTIFAVINNAVNKPLTKKAKAKERLEYLRGEIEAERISYEEIVELQSLRKYIDSSDVLLLQWAGVKEKHS